MTKAELAKLDTLMEGLQAAEEIADQIREKIRVHLMSMAQKRRAPTTKDTGGEG